MTLNDRTEPAHWYSHAAVSKGEVSKGVNQASSMVIHGVDGNRVGQASDRTATAWVKLLIVREVNRVVSLDQHWQLHQTGRGVPTGGALKGTFSWDAEMYLELVWGCAPANERQCSTRGKEQCCKNGHCSLHQVLH
eukprot:1160532-Pelagomonas_calceolata.AAC.1